jgi:hypothetical protein
MAEQRTVETRHKIGGIEVIRRGIYIRHGYRPYYNLSQWQVEVDGKPGRFYRVHGNQRKPIAGFELELSLERIQILSEKKN